MVEAHQARMNKMFEEAERAIYQQQEREEEEERIARCIISINKTQALLAAKQREQGYLTEEELAQLAEGERMKEQFLAPSRFFLQEEENKADLSETSATTTTTTTTTADSSIPWQLPMFKPKARRSAECPLNTIDPEPEVPVTEAVKENGISLGMDTKNYI
jgi:hypothetical protein